MKSNYIIISLIVILLGLSLLTYISPTEQSQITKNVYHYQQTDLQLKVVKRQPTIGECLLAPVDFVVGICSGCVKGVGYGTAYIAETITPTRLYPEDDRCCFCDAKHIKCCCKNTNNVNNIQYEITKINKIKEIK